VPRVKRSVHARKKRRKVLGEAKGYWGLKSKTYTHAKEQVEHSLTYAYRDRKNRKRTMRASGSSTSTRRRQALYNQFVAGCRRPGVELAGRCSRTSLSPTRLPSADRRTGEVRTELVARVTPREV
jgi:large subunit ribosomal protein L20